MEHNQKLTKRAQYLRQHMTREELILWCNFLKGHPAGFRRQYVIGNYIVDFYCPGAKLVIELDGSQHYEEKGREYDVQRTKYLNSCGLTVMRFSNNDIKYELRAVCSQIDNFLLRNSPKNLCNSKKV